ncbi:helix-turn-helix domain-containing protein [Aureispira sp. CCB-E]|uniref:helix-turn-helix domain-containing protein n=1 Tax=Aureispira sp. CCB-E TaxID=3051121 RepID=UPI002868453C|nr:helix-turn-helix domain-containing protein [Aureispira sp. CCB-E]WMX12421.1 helix-turn-helix domain-containing protein [Aureispira sp. CCB-E]
MTEQQVDQIEELKQIIAKQRATIELLESEIERGKIYDYNYINTEQTAKLLDVKPRTVRAYNQQGLITGKKRKKEGRLLFPLKEILNFRKEHLKHWACFD